MRLKNLAIVILVFILCGCASIPKETVLLSKAIGADLQILHKAHRNIVELHYKKIKTDINSFVDDVYSPFVIHYVLNKDFKNFQDGKESLFGVIKEAGLKEGKLESSNAMNEMYDFLNAARKQIERKRIKLLTPIQKQEANMVKTINQSYEQVSYANTTVTSYLKSLQKLKETQEEALSIVGLDGVDSLISNSMIHLSEQIELVVEKGNEIDVKSDDAYKQLEELSNTIKELSSKK